MTIDPYIPAGNRYVDVALGGIHGFDFKVMSNVSWVKISPTSGSLSTDHPDQRVFLDVDWDQVKGVEAAHLIFNATAPTQFQEWRSVVPPGYPSPTVVVSVTLIANHTVVPSD